MLEQDAVERRLRAYFAYIESEPTPASIEELRMVGAARTEPPRGRRWSPAAAIAMAASIVLALVLTFVLVQVLVPRHNSEVDTGDGFQSTRRTTVTTEPDATRRTSPTTVATLPPMSQSSTPTSATTSTTTDSTSTTEGRPPTTPDGQLFADDFSQTPTGSRPLGWAIDSGTWAVERTGNAKGLVGSTQKGQEGRISNGAAEWTDVEVSVAIRRGTQNTVAGVAARYQSASSYYYCKIDGGLLAVGRVLDNQGAILAEANLTTTRNQTVKVHFTVKGSSLQCRANNASVTATDPAMTSGRMALLQDGPATFFDVVVDRT